MTTPSHHPDRAADVRALVALALARIDDDAPDYGEPLAALAQPDALALLEAEPTLARPLFAELRKLRPLPLWVRDRVELALAKKRDAVLDGAICALGAGTSLLVPEGRECWLEVDAAAAESTLRALPSGWGLIVTGDLASVSFPALRRASPLRALGAVLSEPGAQPALTDGTRLDLVIASSPEPSAVATAQALGARVLWSVSTPEALSLSPDAAPSNGVLCDGNAALGWALRLATMRRPGAPAR